MGAGKFLKYLPNSTSFSITTVSSNANNHNNHRAAFSGPIVSLIPKEARTKKKSSRGEPTPSEPTSPKVSCIGQVKQRNKNKCRSESKKYDRKVEEIPSGAVKREEKEEKRKKQSMWLLLRRKVKVTEAKRDVEVVPEIGMMNKFRSGRESLGDFDWRNVVVDRDEDEILVPHSAPMVMGGGGGGVGALERRKEVNLWKRRTLTPPQPLQV